VTTSATTAGTSAAACLPGAAPDGGLPTSRPLGTVLVTGAASGLGRAIAAAVATAGGQPLLLDRVDPREAAGSRPDPTGPWAGRALADAPTAVVDLADTRAAERAVEDVAAAAGGLDAVVTAAGTDSCGRLEDVPGDEWDRVVRVNLLGTAAVIRAALPWLRAARGRIVTVASTLGKRALPDASAYCASKFGVLGLSRALAAELAGEVGLTTLVPGGMDTAFFDGRTEQYRPGPDAMLNDPATVAATVLFALTRPEGCEIRELVVCPSVEPSWP
jgi:NAD(P)-dependent dehydrogenase (short-subunit alcohol dehydrogenase family)